MNIHIPSKFINWPNISIITLLLINLVFGFVTVGNRGLSWDEPLFYNYADNIGYAYSISARLDGTFDLNKAYGVDPEEHMQYGPAYLLISEPITKVIERILMLDEAEAWHITNFLTFQIGILFFYLLCKRWMNGWAAFVSASFFATQPLLWGHGFINPKDIPFTVFFIIAIYFGFQMVDNIIINPGESREQNPRVLKIISSIQKIVLVLATITGALIIFLYAGSYRIVSWIESIIRRAFAAPSEDFLGRVLKWFAPNSEGRPITPYINKAMIVFSQARIGLFVLTILLVALALFMKFKRKMAVEIYQEISQTKVSPILVAIAGVFVGLTTSIRVLGPLAGLLICIYLLARHGRRSLRIIFAYGLIAILVSYATWPYIWAAPIANFINVLKHMSNNPTPVEVLFNSVLINSVTLPITYMPTLLAFTLTEPVWPLFIIGIIFLATRLKRASYDWKALLVPVGWFLIPIFYVIIQRPPMYDGIRHFLFMLPGVFLIAGMGFQAMIDWIKYKWVTVVLIIALLLPGIIGIIRLYPYEYAYYNTFTGGIQGVFRKYDTDYWLTCYKETMQYINKNSPKNTIVYVLRNPSLAQVYAAPGIYVEQFQRNPDNTSPGSLLLLTTRGNADLVYHADAPIVYQNGQAGAIFCVVKQVK